MGRHLLRTVKCRGGGNCRYHSVLNGICHLRGQVRTNTAVSASIFCQRCSTHVFYLRHFSFYTCMPLCTPVAQASVYVLLVHYAKHHMDTCVEVCWALYVMHQLCMRTSPQKHLSCMVYSVFRHPLPCNPSAANMCISHRRLRNTTLLSACTGHQIRASQCKPLGTPVAPAPVYILVHYAKHRMDTCVEVSWALCTMH